MRSSSGERIFCGSMFVLCLAANVWFSSVGWNHNLRELHEFRQIQTALTARSIQQEGWTLAYPTPLFGPPWSVPLEFPLYQICVAQLSTTTGLALKASGRAVSLAALYLSLPALYLLLGHVSISPSRRWLALGLLLVTPVYLYYSRAFLIESTALCFALWFLHAYCRAVETRAFGWLILASGFGVFAGLIKITTFAVVLCPAIAFTAWRLWLIRLTDDPNRAARIKLGLIGFAIAGISVIAAVAWVRYGDAVKRGNPLSQFLVSDTMGDWNFGTLSQRLNLGTWRVLTGHLTDSVVAGLGLLIFLGSVAIADRKARSLITVLCASFLAGPLLFTNLYVLHDYYFCAAGVFLIGAILVGWNALLDWPRISRPIKWTLIAAALAAQVYAYHTSYYRVQSRAEIPMPELAQAIATITSPEDVILMHGFMWNPLIPYASGRKAIMVIDQLASDNEALDTVLSRLPADSIAISVVTGHLRRDAAFVSQLTARLGFSREPLLQDSSTVVFVAPRLRDASNARVRTLALGTLSLNAPPDETFHGVKLYRYRVGDLTDQRLVSEFSPAPSEILAPFGLGSQTVDGREVLKAHAPTMIIFDLPHGANTLSAEFGVTPAAFEGEEKTDGVSFVVEWLPRSGPPVLLFERTLLPADRPEHRVAQRFEAAVPPSQGGQLVLRTLPGPASNISFDWAYWSAVRIR
jgi:hypothetical protein